jgi:hypothetical protein
MSFLSISRQDDTFPVRLPAIVSTSTLPSDDVCRLSYFLKCCVVCGVLTTLPLELVEYPNPHLLPHHFQECIVRVALEELQLEKLLNQLIFIDDEHSVLPSHASHICFQIKSPMDWLAISRLAASQQQLPSKRLILCTSDWLNEYYVLPILRCYQRTSILSSEGQPSPENNPVIQASSLAVDHPTILCDGCKMKGIQGARYRCTGCEDYDLCKACYNDDCDHDRTHTFERIARKGATPEPLARARPSKKHMDIGIVENDEKYIPMAVAVPMAFAIPIDLPSAPMEEDTTAAFLPGQQVRLIGLANNEMNELLAEVKERMLDRIIVHIPNHDCLYSVRPDNLIMVET